MGKVDVQAGQLYGNLEVLEVLPYDKKSRSKICVCKCRCGNTKNIAARSLWLGSTKTCTECSKNSFVEHDGYYRGVTQSGKIFLFDTRDYPIVSKSTWYITSNGYVASRSSGVLRLLHRVILDAPDGFDVDHISGDTLDNRRSNLRIGTHADNMYNQKLRASNTVGHAGLRLLKSGTWAAGITVRYKYIYLGSFSTREEALNARKEAEQKYCNGFEARRSI